LYGKKLIEIIKISPITKNDLIESVGFCLGRAYSAVASFRQNDLITVKDNFTKSTLYGLQILIFIKTGELIFSYNKMQEKIHDLVEEEYLDLINHAIDVRKNNTTVDFAFLYKNISFLNKSVLNKIK
jgi:hypothetical protein